MAFRLWQTLCKLIQRQTYTCLSTRYGILFTFLGLCVISISAFHFGEVLLKWSMIRYAGTFHVSRYYDNIGCKSFETRICLPQPIDVVYTWVNGSDPQLISNLNNIKRELEEELNRTSLKLYAEKKKRGKLINSEMFKWKHVDKCPFPNCVPTDKIAVAGLPRQLTVLQTIRRIDGLFFTASMVTFWDNDSDIAFVQFPSSEPIATIFNSNKTFFYKKNPLNISQVFYTSTIKKGNKRVFNCMLLHNVPSHFTDNYVKETINSKIADAIVDAKLYVNESLALIHVSKESHYNELLKSKALGDFIFKGVRFFPVTYVWKPFHLTVDNQNEDFSTNRFADNDELKYSLRSVQKFAPWVRKIFLVTNGQIPNWLDLNHPRITLVTHDEIFFNKSHLPTFSSPAIESHIHRIPGLSKKFIYMNDDVFFGAEVWPDDFFTHSKGQKVYLSWAVPNCNEGCPASWINDKYCDKACNVSTCDWDGGDCIGNKTKKTWQLQPTANLYMKEKITDFCAPGCAFHWVGDRYCDGNCNHHSCAYDGGDCGLSNFNLLFSHTITSDVFTRLNKTILDVPHGTKAMYVNLSKIFDSVIDGNVEDTRLLRHAILSKKYRVLALTLVKNVSEQVIDLQVLGHRGANETDRAVAFFTLKINTEATKQPNDSVSNSTARSQQEEDEVIPRTVYDDRAKLKQPPTPSVSGLLDFPENILNMSLPNAVQKRLNGAKEMFEKGDLTMHGLKLSMGLIYNNYLRSNEKVTKPGRKLLWFGEKTRSMSMTDTVVDETNYLPWEKGYVGKQFVDMMNRKLMMSKYHHSESRSQRHLLDSYSSSLLHVSRIYNRAFGYKVRKVPAHMPHLVDRDIIYEMQQRFWKYFDATSSHKLRHGEDMQFAFSFNYYVMGVKESWNISILFDKVDTDASGVLSDREIRTLIAILYPLPLHLGDINNVENQLKNCSLRLNHPYGNLKTSKVKHTTDYYDKDMPLVTKELFENCHEVWRMINKSAQSEKYKHELMSEDDLAFKMVRNNASHVLHQLDWIRKHQRKFVCVNDDIDHTREDSKIIRKILRDFYESLFPIPSQFELKSNRINRFLYKNNLDAWKRENRLKAEEMNIIVGFFIFLFLVVLFYKKLLALFKLCLRILFHGERRR